MAQFDNNVCVADQHVEKSLPDGDVSACCDKSSVADQNREESLPCGDVSICGSVFDVDDEVPGSSDLWHSIYRLPRRFPRVGVAML